MKVNRELILKWNRKPTLVEACRQLNLPVTGNKGELLDRIIGTGAILQDFNIIAEREDIDPEDLDGESLDESEGEREEGKGPIEIIEPNGRRLRSLELMKALPVFKVGSSIEVFLKRFETCAKAADIECNNDDVMGWLLMKLDDEIVEKLQLKYANFEKLTYNSIAVALRSWYSTTMSEGEADIKLLHFKLSLLTLREDIKTLKDLVKTKFRNLKASEIEQIYKSELIRRAYEVGPLRDIIRYARHYAIDEIETELILQAENVRQRKKTVTDEENEKKKCFFCKKEGHLKKDCRFRKQKELRTSSNKLTIRTEEEWTPIVREKALSMKKKLSTWMPKVELVLSNAGIALKGYATADSGSAVSVISRELVKRMDFPIEKMLPMYYELADGRSGYTQERSKVNCNITGFDSASGEELTFEVEVPMIVIDKERKEVLLGSNLLDYLKSVVNYGEKSVRVAHPITGRNLNLKVYESNEGKGISLKKIETVDEQDLEMKERLVNKYKGVFEQNKIGCYYESLPKFEYETKKIPKFSRYDIKEQDKQGAQEIFDFWEEQGVIRDSKWPKTILNIHIVHEKTKIRPVLDCRPVNTIYSYYQYPLPLIRDIFLQLKNCKIFSIVDLHSYYLQLRIAEEDQSYLVFRDTHNKVKQFTRLAFGIRHAPSYAQRISEVVADNTIAIPYLDDFVLGSTKVEKHEEEVAKFLEKLKESGLIANQKKTKIGCKTISLLGHIISGDYIAPRVDVLESWRRLPMFTTYKGLRRFVGGVSFFRGSLPNLANALAPLCRVMNKKGKFIETPEIVAAFTEVKKIIENACKVYHPRQDDFIMMSDASSVAIACTLVQKEVTSKKEKEIYKHHKELIKEGDIFYPVGFHSAVIPRRKKFENIEIRKEEYKDKEEGYIPAIELELRSILAGLEYFSFLTGTQRIYVLTDHLPIIAAVRSSTHRLKDEGREEGPTFVEEKLGDENFELLDSTDEESRTSNSMLEEDSDSEEDSEEELTSEEIDSMDNKKIENFQVELKDMEVVKEKEKEEVREATNEEMLKLHNEGHHIGPLKMYEEFIKMGIFAPMSKLKKLVRECERCLMTYIGKKKVFEKSALTAPAPLCRIYIDGMEIRLKPKEGGYYRKLILVAIDDHSRYCWARLVTRFTGKVVRNFLESEIIFRFGAPLLVQFDNAKYFKNSIVEELCKEHGIDIRYSVAYIHESNSCVERMNKEILETLSKCEKITNWVKELEKAVWTLNSTVSSGTSYRPIELMLSTITSSRFERTHLKKTFYESSDQDKLRIAKEISDEKKIQYQRRKGRKNVYKGRSLYKREEESPVKINSPIYVKRHIRAKVSPKYEKRCKAVAYPSENMIEFRKGGKQKLVSVGEIKKSVET
uniref:CCHC-type domain-containing protein n=1 Tax=Parastrongyloides trichosuri TaxID=131310 RepID=A0A0N5A691_PARTI